MSNDCSERICQFGLAHVDTPKGDLDSSSGVLSGPGVNVLTNSDVYPCGTTEQYPAATDSAGNVLTNYAHEYRECSNKGICDRGTGTCACFEGYDGSACQRASCPSTADGMCSGHGTCHTIKEIASMDNDNYYNLWDQHSTMGCICDGDYSGPDCSQRICKSGVDPLYFDEVSTARYSNYTYQFYTQSNAYTLVGNYSLVFTDHSNQQYQTAPIAWNASCWEVRHALETLPNNVIPSGSVRCFKSEMPNGHSNGQYGTASNGIEPIYDAREIIFSKYTIAFPQNPGYLPQMSINTHLDGNRPTLFSTEPVSTLGWHLYPNGFTGEDVDMVPDYCEGVTVTLGVGSSTHYLDGLTVQETKALKTCLGDSDGDATDNVDVYNWDYGNVLNPHLIKLIDATQYYPNAVADIDATSCDNDCKIDAALKMYPSTQLCNTMAGNQAKFGVDGHNIGYCSNLNPAGFFAVLFYDPVHHSSHPFRLFTRAAQDYGTATQFFVFTTTGYLNLVSQHSLAFTQQYSWDTTTVLASHYSNVVHLSNSTTGKSLYPGYFGNIDCETNPIGSNGARDCLNKDDYVMFIASDETSLSSPSHLAANPVYPNMYTVKKIFRQEKTYKTDPSSPNNEGIRHQIHLDFGLNARYTWAGGNSSSTDVSAQVYKFHPPTNNADGGYRYVAQCSGRGICDTSSGLCECFHGYTSDNCGVINALAQ